MAGHLPVLIGDKPFIPKIMRSIQVFRGNARRQRGFAVVPFAGWWVYSVRRVFATGVVMTRRNGIERMANVKRLLKWGLGIESLAGGILLFSLALAVLAVAVRFFFWGYTGRVWEDALIAVLHAENCAKGLGMTHYRTGAAPLQGFSSPLGVLVPLVGDMFRVGFGLFFIRVVSALSGGLAVLYAMAIARHPTVKLPGAAAFMAAGYLAFEHHQIFWGMAGMETQMATLVLLMSLYFTVAQKPIALGLSLGLCMLARPDFAFWAVIAGGYILLFARRGFLETVGVALAVYMPWILFTMVYYGSPIPNTIVAKWPTYAASTSHPILTWGWLRDLLGAILHPLGPAFAGHGLHYRPLFGGHGLILMAMAGLALIGAAAALRRKQWALLPVAGFVAVYSTYYVFFVARVFGWYVTPFVVMVLFLSGRGLQAFGCFGRAVRGVARVAGVAYVVLFAAFLPQTFAAEKRIQEDIENPVRKSIGLYLAEVMKPDESVGSEPLGYIGYGSRRTVYDWPGLANRKVVEYIKTHPGRRSIEQMFEHFRPDFLVFRYAEYANAWAQRWLDEDYKIIASFEAPRAKTNDILQITENIDRGYFVLAKRNWDGPARGIGPHHAGAYCAIGRRFARQGRQQQAIEFYRRALAIDPGCAEAHRSLAVELALLGRMEEAAHHMAQGIGALRENLKFHPTDTGTRYDLAAGLSLMGRAEEAIREYERVLDIDPRSAYAHQALGVELAKTNRIDAAIAHFSEAVRLDPEYALAHTNLGLLLAAQGKPAEAAQHFREALAIDPNNQNARAALEKLSADFRGGGGG